MELAQRTGVTGRAFSSLGTRPVAADGMATWVYDPALGEPVLRSRYHPAGGDLYTTTWQRIEPGGVVLGPAVRERTVAVHLAAGLTDKQAAGAETAVEVELRPATGEGGAVRRTVRPGQAATLRMLVGPTGDGLYRVRQPGHAWSAWKSLTAPVLLLKGAPC
jgi:hypothetical protein